MAGLKGQLHDFLIVVLLGHRFLPVWMGMRRRIFLRAGRIVNANYSIAGNGRGVNDADLIRYIFTHSAHTDSMTIQEKERWQMGQMRGKASLAFERPPVILSSGSVAGSKEGQGPLGPFFDRVETDDRMGDTGE